MRLLFNPLTITADGETVDNDLQGALVFLDSGNKGNYTKADIAEAMQGNAVSLLADTLKSYGDCTDSLDLKKGQYNDHLINCYIGQGHRERYRDEVLHDTQEPAFSQNMMRFLNTSMNRIAQSDPAVVNQRSLAFKDPWDSMKYDKIKDTLFKKRFNKILDESPGYVEKIVKADPSLTIICTTGLVAGIMALGGMGAAAPNQIRLSYRNFIEGPERVAASVLKEEILHYLDDQIGASKTPEYQQAAKALLSNNAKMDAIEQQFKEIVPDKQPLREYPEDHHNAELFVTYFLIRDHLCEQQAGRSGSGWAGKHIAKDAEVPAAVNKQMAELFGQELQELCVKAETTLKSKARNVQSVASGPATHLAF